MPYANAIRVLLDLWRHSVQRKYQTFSLEQNAYWNVQLIEPRFSNV